MAKNGQLDRRTLTLIRPGRWLRNDAAWWFNQMNAAFKAHFGYDIGVTDAYRDLAEQVRLKAIKGPFAAKPGTSNHGWAIALDLGTQINSFTSAQHKWMVANAGRWGWSNPLWARDNNPKNGQQEPWHWEFDGRDIPSGGGAGQEEDDMTPGQAAQLDLIARQMNDVIARLERVEQETPKRVWSYKNPTVNARYDVYGMVAELFRMHVPVTRNGKPVEIRAVWVQTLAQAEKIASAVAALGKK